MTTKPTARAKTSRYGFSHSNSKPKKFNFGSGGNRKKAKVSLAPIATGEVTIKGLEKK